MKRKISILFLLFICLIGYAQTDSNLKGKELKKATGISAGIQSGIGMIFGAGKIEGTIQKVVVTDENLMEIKVIVSFTGYDSIWLKGSILTENNLAIQSISSPPALLNPGEGSKEIELTFTKIKEDTIPESAYLKLMACKKAKDVTGLVSIYNLKKTWGNSGSGKQEQIYGFINEGLVIPIDPIPVGVAKNINQNDPLPQPSAVYKVKFNESMYKGGILERKSMMIGNMVDINSKANNQPPTPVRPGRPGSKTDQTQGKQVSSITMKPGMDKMNAERVKTDMAKSSQEQVSKEPKGPGKIIIPLFDQIQTDEGVDFDYGQEYIVTNINLDIWQDENDKSGYYYYTPASYSLQWDNENSYQMKVLYGSAQNEEENGLVKINLTITPSISKNEHEMVKTLIQDYTQSNQLYFEKLMPLPLKETPPEVNLTDILDFIPADGINTNYTDIFNPIKISWSMTSKKADDLMVLFKEGGFQGHLLLKPDGIGPDVLPPVVIKLGDERTFGRLILEKNLWRGQILKNEMPFPIRLKYIHALVLKKEQAGNSTPWIYTWDLNNQEVPVLASVQFKADRIPPRIDNEAERIWIEYTVPDCPPCIDKIMNDLTSGTVSSRQQRIEVISYGIIGRTKAFVMEVTIRSILADPNGTTVVELPPIKIKTDEESYTVGPIYVPQGKNLEYEYKIKMVTDEEVLNSNWIKSMDPTLYLNKSKVEAALGKFPEKIDQ